MIEAPEKISAEPDEKHGWFHGHASDCLAQEGGHVFIRMDIHEAAVQESHELGLKATFEAFVNKKQEAAFAPEAAELLEYLNTDLRKVTCATKKDATRLDEMIANIDALLSKQEADG